MKEQLAEAKNFIMFKRLDYLIEIVKQADVFNKYGKDSLLHKALAELDETIYPQAEIEEEETHHTNTID